MRIIKWSLIFISVILLSGCFEFGEHVKKGYEYLDTGKYSEADQEFQKALELKPENEKALRGRSITQTILKERQRAQQAELEASAAQTELKLVKQTSKEEIAQLQSKLSRAEEEKKKLEEDFKKEKAKLKAEIAEKSRKIAELEKKLSDLQEEMRGLKGELAQTKSTLASLQQQLAEQKGVEEKLREQLQQAQAAPIEELEELKKENQTLKKQLGVIEKRILALKQGKYLARRSALSQREPLKEIDQLFDDAIARLNQIESEVMELELESQD